MLWIRFRLLHCWFYFVLILVICFRSVLALLVLFVMEIVLFINIRCVFWASFYGCYYYHNIIVIDFMYCAGQSRIFVILDFWPSLLKKECNDVTLFQKKKCLWACISLKSLMLTYNYYILIINEYLNTFSLLWLCKKFV